MPRGQAAEVASAARTGTRKAMVSNRGKSDAVFRWPEVDAAAVEQAHKRHVRLYREHHRSLDPSGVYRLSLSPFTATALERALDQPREWLHTVRNDGRKERVPGGTRQVGLIWPVALAERLHEMWEDLDIEMSVDGFALTKANLAIAGILHSLARVEEWVMDVPNDDRFSEPTALDGRVGPRRAPETAEV